MLDPGSLDPHDFDLLEGLTATLVDPDRDGVEIVWRDEDDGLVGHAVVIFKDTDAVWTELEVVPDWWKRGLGSAVVKDLLKPMRKAGVKRYVIPDTAAGATQFFIDRGFTREGEQLVGTTASQGKLARGRQ